MTNTNERGESLTVPVTSEMANFFSKYYAIMWRQACGTRDIATYVLSHLNNTFLEQAEPKTPDLTKKILDKGGVPREFNLSRDNQYLR